jgi:hypothetical protein
MDETSASIRFLKWLGRFFGFLLVPFFLLSLLVGWLLSKLKRPLGSLLLKLRRTAAWLLSKPPVRTVKWLVDRLLSIRKWFVLSVIVALTTVLIFVFTKTEQGRDLVQLARDQGSGFVLFSGLSAAMVLVVFLVLPPLENLWAI